MSFIQTKLVMVKKLIMYCSSLLILSSCGSYGPQYTYRYKGRNIETSHIYHPYISICTLMDGYWGNWINNNYLRCICKTVDSKIVITYYLKNNHPSEYEYRITLNKYIEFSNDWTKYDGQISIKRENEQQLQKHYSTLNFDSNSRYWTFPCKISRKFNDNLPQGQYIIPEIQHDLFYTYNVFYNGVGRGFTIDGSWQSADDYYDPWF